MTSRSSPPRSGRSASGESVIDPKIVDVLVAARVQRDGDELAALSSRERAVLAEIAQGKSNVAIANSLQLSKRAVEKHTHAIFTKLGLTGSAEISRRVKAALLFLADADGRELLGVAPAARGSPGQDAGLLARELLVREDALVLERGQFLELFDAVLAGRRGRGGGRRSRVLLRRLLVLLGVLLPPSGSPAGG